MNSSKHQNKKIKPVDSPDLVLKSPIAYHGVSDLSVVPINKDGIAVCEKCGAIGVKHTFYTKQRKFCSLSCARSYTGIFFPKENESYDNNIENKPERNHSNSNKKQANYKFKLMDSTDHLVGMIPMEPLPQLPGMWQPVLDDFLQPLPTKSTILSRSYEWQNELMKSDFPAADVRLFPHAPLSNMWNNVFVGMKVEVKNTDSNQDIHLVNEYFWVATVLKLKGYLGLLRYEGFGNDGSKDFWLNLMHSEVHPVGWCATRGKPLIPPSSIENKYPNWKIFLVQRLTGARTLPTDFYNKANESFKSRFRIGHRLEVVDKNRICQVKLSTVREIVGKRLHIRYYDSTGTNEENGFWCHEDCPLIHQVGWARDVGHLIDAPPDYIERVNNHIVDKDDATADLFKYYTKRDPHNANMGSTFVEGMKLEAIDPLNLSSVCVSTIMKVLNYGHLMIRIDCYPPDETGSDWFCYHEYSPYIFPVGFCDERGIPLTTTNGQLPQPLNEALIAQLDPPQHAFTIGMSLECADLMDPRLVCVSTVCAVVGRLLKVHFNGWGEEYDQWLDFESPDIYPVGWCQAVGHNLEGPLPPIQPPPPPPPPRKKGRKRKPKAQSDLQKQIKSDVLDNLSDKSNEELIKSEDDFTESTSNSDDKNLNSTQLTTIDNTLENNQNMFNMNVDNKPNFELNDDTLDTLKMETEEDSREFADMQIKSEPRIPKAIPRLVGVVTDSKTMEGIEPETWDSQDVAEFLSANDCAPYCMNFCEITGQTMLDLTKDQIIELLQMKVGPSLKIYDLIQQLKCKLKPVHARNKAFIK